MTVGKRQAIKSGTVADYLNKQETEATFFLSDAVIPNLPSTKKRSRLKRAMVLAMEIEQIRSEIRPGEFPLAKSRAERRTGSSC